MAPAAPICLISVHAGTDGTSSRNRSVRVHAVRSCMRLLATRWSFAGALPWQAQGTSGNRLRAEGTVSMTDPSDDAEPAAPAGSPTPPIADHDGGVARRLTTRCRIAAAVLLVFAVGCLLIGLLNDLTTSTALLLLV